ncbi:uncharacterized protein PGTG_21187 [Puccinia graminis f. sp. tritici CRL 75-36-700-3]|uniref:Uncharacterized protein n=1 Tax=Puccinia graminis f. sp. tritici (strain CRL 75-36-700-3 / race SCCL) TaxID=418459 RepID=H6QQH9_PUCGT|nr:uncharacterized protein PGTG_21187 [Puccinia graminis f. sp. tritici CRL 75-36-700-3]EHS62679.1 hypothetical protein PGTG_21187 [Puccinia graminis f. sp. tritici CRL 75-36-700-3]
MLRARPSMKQITSARVAAFAGIVAWIVSFSTPAASAAQDIVVAPLARAETAAAKSHIGQHQASTDETVCDVCKDAGRAYCNCTA